MSTVYDIRITTQGFFTMFGYHVHTPANITGLDENQLDQVELAGWLYDVLATHEDVEVIDSIYAEEARRFICPTEADIEKIKGIRDGDWVLVESTGKLYTYRES